MAKPSGLCTDLLQITWSDPYAANGTCNADLPNESAYTRFLYVIRFLTSNGLYVLIDNHLSFDDTAATNTKQWLAW